MELLSQDQLDAALENGKKLKNDDGSELPAVALLKLAGSTWMLAAIDPENNDQAFGLVEIAGGSPELGYFSLKELNELRGHDGQSIWHDPLFQSADKLDINQYARMARGLGQITLQFTEKVTLDDLDLESLKEDLEKEAKAKKSKRRNKD